MSSVPVTPEQREMLERQAISVFTEIVNTGRSFQEALAAVYLTGIEHGSSLVKDENDEH
jgi:hypothetical protein